MKLNQWKIESKARKCYFKIYFSWYTHFKVQLNWSVNLEHCLNVYQNILTVTYHTDDYFCELKVRVRVGDIVNIIDHSCSITADLKKVYILSGIISSPGYPSNYYNSIDKCLLHIKVIPGSILTIHFIVFNVEKHSTCDYDSLQVKPGFIILHNC